MPSLGLCKACVENGRAAGRATAVSRVKAEIVLVGTHPVQYPSVAHGWGRANCRFQDYGWKKKFGGMSGDEVQRLRQLEQENGRLKRALADAMLDNQILKELNAKKW